MKVQSSNRNKCSNSKPRISDFGTSDKKIVQKERYLRTKLYKLLTKVRSVFCDTKK